MADDPTKRGPADARRVDVSQDHERRYWCEKWQVSPGDLQDAVARVGPMAADVARALGRPVPGKAM